VERFSLTKSVYALLHLKTLIYCEAAYGRFADEMSDKPFGWDAMLNRKAVRAAVRNAEAIKWVRSHTVRDLECLADEKKARGDDARGIIDLLDELREIDRSLCSELELVPETCE